MKHKHITLLAFSVLTFIITSCNNSSEEKEPGSVAIIFNNQVGVNDIILREPGDQTYDFTDSNGQAFNISTFSYYISEVVLSGTDGIGYADPNKITIDPTKLTGFYHVRESEPTSQIIDIVNVPARSYNKLKFTIGIQSYDVIEGTPGGILDPANGALYLNDEAGYANMAIKGNASNSGQEYIPMGNEPEILAGTFSLLVSGWKDVLPEQGQDPIFVDNTRTIEIDFDQEVLIKEGLNPSVQIQVNLAEILDQINFSQSYDIDRPFEGTVLANTLTEAVTLDFISQ